MATKIMEIMSNPSKTTVKEEVKEDLIPNMSMSVQIATASIARPASQQFHPSIVLSGMKTRSLR